MRRFHLFEWEDQPWLPTVFRDFITDHLRYTLNEQMRRPVNVAIAERLKSLLVQTKKTRIVDLCAGAGGPLVGLTRILEEEMGFPVEVLVTDMYPNVAAFRRLVAESNGRITARYEPTSAVDVPTDLDGVRTLFTALHHFKAEQVRLVFGDAVRKGAPIAVFEPLERTIRMMALVGVMSLVRGFTHTPRIGNLTLSRLIFTYLVPVAPIILAWDGMVSALRTYSPEEMLALARSITSGNYRWEAGKFQVLGPYGPMPTTYLIGNPSQ